ncbi:MAG: family 43 glycosylhydrolase [Paludibacter sp.]|nr:family 43 glycosylhydrolase [Paludibacter sp.]
MTKIEQTRLLMMKKIIFPILALFGAMSLFAGNYGDANTNDLKTKIPSIVKPVFDYWMRDTWVMLGPDGNYYLTGTTADMSRKYSGQIHCWDWNDGIYLWKSKDLKNWESCGIVWSIQRDGTWQKNPKVYMPNEKYARKSINDDPLDNKFMAVWAPEIHYLKNLKNWFIVACMNNSAVGAGSFILKSVTGKPEGPYVNIKQNETKPIFDEIDGSLFEDTDGSVYFVGHNHYIAKMKQDMSGFTEKVKQLKETPYTPEPYIEGATIFKKNGKYQLVQAIWSFRLPDRKETYIEQQGIAGKKMRYSYDCIIATADNIYGPYSNRYNAITGGGHNNLFEDKDGNWWATIFFNPRGAQAKNYEKTCRPGLVPMQYREGKFSPKNK